MPEPRLILVVEDDQQYAQVLCAMISLRPGHRALVAYTMREAIISMKEHAFDVTLLDLSLPDSTVTETLDKIPVLKAFGAGRVIVLTGVQVTPNLQLAAQVAGASGIAGKDNINLDDFLDSEVTKT